MQNLYKRYKLVILLSIISGMMWAQITPQPNYTLTDNQSGTVKAYVARDYVSLKPGFSYTATTGTSFNAKIDAGLLFPPTDKTYQKTDGTFTTDPTQGAMVGSIPGTASVSPTGAANYQIPIEVPTGINGMQPQVSIGYSSQGGFGALGIGWDITGVSSISRSPQNLYYDGAQSNSIQFDETDRLILDGKRLVNLTNSIQSGRDIYGFEVEDYSRISQSVDLTTLLPYYILTTKDGKTLEYGRTTDSRLTNTDNPSDGKILTWKLDKMTDCYGNSISYTYSDNGQYLTKIEYAGQTVSFVYNTILDVLKNIHIKDFLITQTKLLSAITIQSGTNILKSYGFNYMSTSDNRLKSVVEKASDNTQLNSTNINWNTDGKIQDDFYSNTITLNSFSQTDLLETDGLSIYFADLNGDGYKDLIQLWQGSSDKNGYMDVYFYNPTYKQYTSVADYHKEFAWNNQNIQYKIMCQDINKDGKDEILLLHLYNIIQFTYDGNQFIPTGIPFLGNLAVMNGYPTLLTPGGYSSLFADVNNDSYPDLVIMPQGNFDNVQKWSQIFYGSKDGYSEANSTKDDKYVDDCYYYATGGWDSQIGNGDFNADGKSDIMVYGNINKNSYVHEYEGATVFFDPSWNSLIKDTRISNNMMYDFNNDGITDIIAQDNSNNYNWKLILGGSNYTHQSPISLPLHNSFAANCNEERDFAQMIDYNGDGFMDVVLADETWKDHDGWTWLTGKHDFVETNWYFYKNIGGTFTLDKQFTTGDRLPKMKPTISDINGDGIDDLIIPRMNIHTYTYMQCPDNGSLPQQAQSQSLTVDVAQPPGDGGSGCYEVTGSYTTYDYFAFTFPNANRRNMVSGITNGMGQTNSFAYKNFSNYDQTAISTPLRYVKAPIIVVDTQTEPDGSITNYTFEHPKMHTEGKGFLGFATITAINTQKNIKTTSNYDVDTTYFGVCLKSQSVSTAQGTDDISTSTSTNGVIVIDASKKRYIPIVTSQTSYDALKTITQTGTANYDSYPNSITQTSIIGDLTITTATTFTGPTGKTPYLPSSVTTTRAQNGQSTRVTNYGYTFDGTNPYKITNRTETSDTGDENQVATTYSNYDTWGHPKTISVTANGKTRTSTISYVPSGRFVASKTNTLGEATTYNWNETTGLLDSEKDEKRNWTTSYKYNSWRHLTETLHPDGIREANVLQWAGTTGVSGAQYYTYSEASGESPVIVWYDMLGREIQKDTYGLNGKKISESTEYYTAGVNKGRLYRVSEPYFEADAGTKTWAKTYDTYDDYGRATKVITPMGNIITEYNKLTTTVTTPEGTSKTVLNSAGQTFTSSVNNKTVTYAYYPSGLTKTSTPDGGQPLTMEYNLQGKRTKLIDPDGGTVESKYNGFGDLLWERQKIHNNTDYVTTTNTYDPDGLGLLQNINRNGEVTTYTYDTNYKSRVDAIEIAGKNKQVFSYDDFDRVTNVQETIGARVYNTGKVYDLFGRVQKETYPSGFYTVNTYDSYSNLTEVKDNVSRSIWKAIDENARGQLLHESKGGKTTSYGFDTRGLPTSIAAPGVEDMAYLFDSKGNLQYRTDNLTNQNEQFAYDGQNRLTNWDVYQSGALAKQNSITFDATTSNITAKSDLGGFTMNYGGKRADNSDIGPHALATIAGVPANFPTADLNVTYTDFKKIATLSEGIKNYALTYGVDDQRRMSVYSESGVTKLTRYYVGDYEEEVNSVGNVRKIHYLCGGAMLIQNNGVDSLLYTYSDYQGSLIALTDASGNVVEKYAYDPWGARRNPTNWTQKDLRTKWIVNRGYTGHEHLDAFGIINMNGRVYDPLTAQFFSPDPHVQAPGNWLNYNRYSYCMGNPFKYSDPSGELFFYVIPSFSYSYYGGLQVNVSASIGISNAASAGISVGYNFKYGNWSATVSGSLGGFYGYAGYDSKAGFIAGVGYGLGGPMWGSLGMSGSFWSLGVNYSASGGFSASAFGASYGKGGFNFDLSFGASAMYYLTENKQFLYSNDIDDTVDPNDNSGKPNISYGDNEGLNNLADEWFVRPNTLTSMNADGTSPDGVDYKDGWMIDKENNQKAYAVTVNKGFSSKVYIGERSFKSNAFLFLTIQHEYAHVVMNGLGIFNKKNRQEMIANNLSMNQANEWKMYGYSDLFLRNYQANSQMINESDNKQYIYNKINYSVKRIQPW